MTSFQIEDKTGRTRFFEETFIIYVTFFNLAPILIHSDRKAQIASLLIEKVKISDKYLDFINVFSEKKALVLLEQTKLNEHIIDLEDDK